jgi:hypothetical protein
VNCVAKRRPCCASVRRSPYDGKPSSLCTLCSVGSTVASFCVHFRRVFLLVWLMGLCLCWPHWLMGLWLMGLCFPPGAGLMHAVQVVASMRRCIQQRCSVQSRCSMLPCSYFRCGAHQPRSPFSLCSDAHPTAWHCPSLHCTHTVIWRVWKIAHSTHTSLHAHSHLASVEDCSGEPAQRFCCDEPHGREGGNTRRISGWGGVCAMLRVRIDR